MVLCRIYVHTSTHIYVHIHRCIHRVYTHTLYIYTACIHAYMHTPIRITYTYSHTEDEASVVASAPGAVLSSYQGDLSASNIRNIQRHREAICLVRICSINFILFSLILSLFVILLDTSIDKSGKGDASAVCCKVEGCVVEGCIVEGCIEEDCIVEGCKVEASFSPSFLWLLLNLCA